MKERQHIMCTRKLENESVRQLEEAGLRVTHHNFIKTVVDISSTQSSRDIQPYVALTSRMGVRAFLQIIKLWNLNKSDYTVFCTEPTTARVAKLSGLFVGATATNSGLLAKKVARINSVNHLTHLCGNLEGGRLSKSLLNERVHVDRLMVYRTTYSPVLVDDDYTAVIYFSPSGIDSFLSINRLVEVPAYCVGETTGSYALRKGYSQIVVSQLPTESALLKMVSKIV